MHSKHPAIDRASLGKTMHALQSRVLNGPGDVALSLRSGRLAGESAQGVGGLHPCEVQRRCGRKAWQTLGMLLVTQRDWHRPA